jgi:hypothetical protein
MSLKVRGQIATANGSYDRADGDLREALRVIAGLHQAIIEVDVRLRQAQLGYSRHDLAGARSIVAELDRQNLPALRADLADEFARLKVALASDPSAAP